jgi:capsular polysaccharide biosynthesis protein
MDLYNYLTMVRRRWAVAFLGFLTTITLTVTFVDQQPSIYETEATFVIRPRTVNTADGVRAIDTLTRGVEISSTYATIARSDLIRDRAEQRVDPALNTSGLKVSSQVVTSTNILEVTVSGQDPEAIQALATEISQATVEYVAELQPVFELQILDTPQLPGSPVAPNRPLIIGTGVVLSVAVSVIFALIAEASARPSRGKPKPFNVDLTGAVERNESWSYLYGEIDTSEEDTTGMVDGDHNGHRPAAAARAQRTSSARSGPRSGDRPAS